MRGLVLAWGAVALIRRTERRHTCGLAELILAALVSVALMIAVGALAGP
jgi:hypothetical protein